ncbi:hypothetical protein J6590_001563 [Homalodisca vitripennis]|nr:hypothetical protein J6590_001563 [Homalodisca vitripennis]
MQGTARQSQSLRGASTLITQSGGIVSTYGMRGFSRRAFNISTGAFSKHGHRAGAGPILEYSNLEPFPPPFLPAV